MPETRPSRIRRLAIVLIALAAVPLIAWGWNRFAPRRTPEGQPPLEHLDARGVERLRAQFNDATGQPRLLVLLSPT